METLHELDSAVCGLRSKISPALKPDEAKEIVEDIESLLDKVEWDMARILYLWLPQFNDLEKDYSVKYYQSLINDLLNYKEDALKNIVLYNI